jgi:hypothetical protein
MLRIEFLSLGHDREGFSCGERDLDDYHQLLRCCNCYRCFDVRKYASLLDNCAPCIWRFLLSHPLSKSEHDDLLKIPP